MPRPRRPSRSRARARRAPRGSAPAARRPRVRPPRPRRPRRARRRPPRPGLRSRRTSSTERADAGTTTLGSRAASPSAEAARRPATHSSNRSGSSTTCVCTNAAPAATLAASDAGGVKPGDAAAPTSSRGGGPSTRDPSGRMPRREIGQQAHQAGGVEVAHRHPGSALRQWIAAERQDGTDPDRGGAQRVRRQGDPVAVAAGHLQDRLSPGRDGDRRGRKGRHARAAAGQVGDVQPVGERELLDRPLDRRPRRRRAAARARR